MTNEPMGEHDAGVQSNTTPPCDHGSVDTINHGTCSAFCPIRQPQLYVSTSSLAGDPDDSNTYDITPTNVTLTGSKFLDSLVSPIVFLSLEDLDIHPVSTVPQYCSHLGMNPTEDTSCHPVPLHYNDAMHLDCCDGNTQWQEAIADLELAKINVQDISHDMQDNMDKIPARSELIPLAAATNDDEDICSSMIPSPCSWPHAMATHEGLWHLS
jgi:hypothetical protein